MFELARSSIISAYSYTSITSLGGDKITTTTIDKDISEVKIKQDVSDLPP